MVSSKGSTSAGKGRRFAAAVDAADLEQPLWLHERLDDERDKPCLRTQRRWVEWSGRMLGLAGGLSRKSIESVVDLLGITGMAHQEARRRFAKARDIRRRSIAIVSVLVLLKVDEGLLFRLLGAGCVSGGLAPSWLWSAESSALVFPCSGTLAPTAGRCRPPPPFEIGSH